jgi:hypothetical protein
MVCRFEAREAVPTAEDQQRRFLLRSIVSIIVAPTYRLARHLADLLGSHIGNSPHHIKSSAGLLRTLGSLLAGAQDIVVTFDMVSLFTMVPVMEAMSRHFEEHVLRLFCHVLTSSSFSCAAQSYGCSSRLATRRSTQPIVNSLLAVLQRLNAGQFDAVRFADTSLVDQPKSGALPMNQKINNTYRIAVGKHKTEETFGRPEHVLKTILKWILS